MLSIAGAASGIAAGLLVAKGLTAFGVAVWLASRVLDGMDGLLARETGRASAFGGYLAGRAAPGA